MVAVMPALPRKVAFRQELTGNPQADRAQRQAQQVSRALDETNAVVATLPFLNGVHIKDCVIATVNTTITHNLGRVPVGYICTRIQTNAVPWRESAAASQPTDKTTQYAFIASGASVTLDLYFF